MPGRTSPSREPFAPLTLNFTESLALAVRSPIQVLLGFCSPHHLHSYKHGSNASIHGFWDPKMNREQTLIFYSSPAPNFDLVVGKRVSGGNAANRLLDGQDRSTHTRQCSTHTC